MVLCPTRELADQVTQEIRRLARSADNIKEHLADFHLKGEHTIIMVTVEQIAEAIAAHQATKKITGKNLLMPKPKPVEDNKRPGQCKPFKSFATRRRKEG